MAFICCFRLLCVFWLIVITEGLSFVERFPSSVKDSFTSSSSSLSIRCSNDGVSWEEVIIPPPLSKQQHGGKEDLQGCTIGQRIQFGESVLLLKDFVDPETCQELVQLVRESQGGDNGSDDDDKVGLQRIPTIAAAKRALRNKTPCVDPMGSKADAICQAILLRALSCIDEDQPTVTKILFPSLSLSMADAFLNEKDNATTNHHLQWSSREPAVNVYTPGGKFLAHTDSQSLTILVALTEPLVDGGTAFWSQDSRGHRVEGPSMTLRPSVGTALLFGGCVTHAGMPINDGLRSVLVASFS